MDKRMILAVAGAGKTYYICNHLNVDDKNLILTYTNENVNNIIAELYKTYSEIPEKTSVMTFHAFLNRLLISPYLTSILQTFSVENIKIRGITTNKSPSIRENNSHNKFYCTKDSFRHYIDNSDRLYCDCLGELFVELVKKNSVLGKMILSNLNKFFDIILIDEFQDYRCSEYDVLMKIVKSCQNVLLVGDFYQHSVYGANNTGKPFKNRTKCLSYDEFKEKLPKKIKIDETLLIKSRRCSKKICEFISKKLLIKIDSAGINNGDVIVIDNQLQADQILLDDNIIKLVYSKSKEQPFLAINWSYSKGSTYAGVCVILTNKTEKIIDDDFDVLKMDLGITLNKLYVALTRSSGDVYLLINEYVKKYKQNR